MVGRDEKFEEVAEVQRTTKAEARRRGIGTPEPGAEPPARAYPDETGVADLGAGEPVLSPPDSDDGGARPASDPTGVFAGETEADRRDEEEVRRVLEREFPRTRGTWKVGGRVPSGDARTIPGG